MEDVEDQNVVVSFVHTQPWVLYFDGSNTDLLSGAGVALVNPSGVRHCYSFQLEWKCTNNQAEYEAIIIGLELLLDLEVTEVEVLGDSLLVINQLKGVYKCNNFTLLPFWERASELWHSRKDFGGSETHITFLYGKEIDWRQPIIQYLNDPSAPVDKRVRYFTTNYVFRGGEVFRRAEDGLYL
ncbi:uncharacterized protein LOC126784039 [Argentina anserina]|uniref:uncharacterized protein LOC126784039 n=1 Tax=Argentina anserina TaxID=57926 RepID=UPI0021767180|nr:uncharacterized protein LOC126784039 [Potentilla anserina]